MKLIIKKYLSLWLFVQILFPSFLNSQGYLLKKGESAFIPAVDFYSNNQYSGYSGSIHYNYNGLLSVGFKLGKSEMKDVSSKLNYTRLSLISFPLKQSDEFPFSIDMGTELQFNSFDNDIIDSVYLYYSDRTFILFGDIYYHIPISTQTEIIPGISLQYYVNSVVAVNTYLHHLYGKSRATSFSVFISSAFYISKNVIISIKPEIYFDISASDSSPTYALSSSFTLK